MTKRSPKTQLWIILMIVFFGFLGLSMPYLIFPPLFLNPDYSILPPDWSETTRGLFLGITLAAYPFGQFIGSPILGALSDDYGRRKILSVSLFATACCSLLTALAVDFKVFWLLLVSRFIAGIMEGNIAIARAMAADIKEISKHRTFGLINAAASVAYILGPLIGGLLSDHTVYEDLAISTPFFLICLLFFTLSFVSFMMIQERPRPIKQAKRSFSERINFIARLKSLFVNQSLKNLLIVITLYTLAVDMFYEFGPVYLTAIWMVGPAQLSIYNGFFALTGTIGSAWLAGELAKYYPKHKIVICSLVGVSTAVFSIAFISNTVIMFTLFGLLGFFVSVATTNLTVQVSDSSPDKIQGEVMGVLTSLRVLGDAIICLAGGALLAISPGSVLVIAAIFPIISILYYLNKEVNNVSMDR